MLTPDCSMLTPDGSIGEYLVAMAVLSLIAMIATLFATHHYLEYYALSFANTLQIGHFLHCKILIAHLVLPLILLGNHRRNLIAIAVNICNNYPYSTKFLSMIAVLYNENS